MRCATCQPMSILRQTGEAVVKKQAFLLGQSQRVIYHIKAWLNRGYRLGRASQKTSFSTETYDLMPVKFGTESIL